MVAGGLVAKPCLTLATPWTGACQSPLSLGSFEILHVYLVPQLECDINYLEASFHCNILLHLVLIRDYSLASCVNN